MLHYSDRGRKIHIITLDRVLATDVHERLSEFAERQSVEMVVPGEGKAGIVPADIEGLARDTTTSRILIMDVRMQTRARLQRAYSDIVRFNRPDFNLHCYSVLIGDGPTSLLDHGRGMEALHTFLTDLRVNFSPAVFFASPFLYYGFDEIQKAAIYGNNGFPKEIPQRLQKYFKDDKLTVERVCRYFRAADAQNGGRLENKIKRQKELKRLFVKILKDEFGNDKDQLIKALYKQGCALPGESLRLNIYPFFSEEWVQDLIDGRSGQ